jgi:hypothetical protein
MPEKMPNIVKKMKMPDKFKTIKMPDMVKKIKMLDMVAVRRIKMPEKMEHRQVAGCRTLTFKHCFSSRQAMRGMRLERKPSW